MDCQTLQAKNAIYKGLRIIYQHESVYMVFKAHNPLKVPITLSNIQIITDGPKIHTEDTVHLRPHTTEIVHIKFQIERLGKIAILGLTYELFGLVTDVLCKFYAQ